MLALIELQHKLSFIHPLLNHLLFLLQIVLYRNATTTNNPLDIILK